MRAVGMTGLDRPWHRPGAVRYALRRLPGLLRPPVSVYEPAAGSLSVLQGYAVVNCDLRGAGTSEGTASLLLTGAPIPFRVADRAGGARYRGRKSSSSRLIASGASSCIQWPGPSTRS